MPLNLNTPIIATLDKVRVEQFTVSPQLGTVMIHYSKGYDDENGQYIAREYASENFEDVVFDSALYDLVKTALYDLLNTKLNNG
jgi:hypothetical protein